LKNYRAHPPKFKKKIILLLRAALAESAELSAVFKIKRAAALAQAAAQEIAPAAQEIKRYAEDSAEFKAALSSVPQSLLDLIERQFGARAHGLATGVLAAAKKDNEPARNPDILTDDDASAGYED